MFDPDDQDFVGALLFVSFVLGIVFIIVLGAFVV